MNEDKARNDLEYIRSVMESVRQRNAIDAVYYLIWGVVIPLCTLATWILGNRGLEDRIGIVWIVGLAVGSLSSFAAGWIRSRTGPEPPPRQELKMYYTAWILFGINSIALMIVGWGFGKLDVPQVLFILGLLLALVYALDATFAGLRFMYVVAFGWLSVGVLSAFLPLPASSLVFGFSTIPLQLVPGLLLNRIYRRVSDGTAGLPEPRRTVSRPDTTGRRFSADQGNHARFRGPEETDRCHRGKPGHPSEKAGGRRLCGHGKGFSRPSPENHLHINRCRAGWIPFLCRIPGRIYHTPAGRGEGR